MNTKNNKRRRESRDKIEKTFVTLLQDRELSRITVADICKHCGLNRSTFYANYLDVYDLADKIRTDLEQEVLGLYTAEDGGYIDGHNYLPLFYHIRENPLFYKTYFKLGYDSTHQVKLYDAARAQQDFGNQNIDYHIAFFHGGFNAIVKRWLAGGCQESPKKCRQLSNLSTRDAEKIPWLWENIPPLLTKSTFCGII